MEDTMERNERLRPGAGVPGWERFSWLRAGFSTRWDSESILEGTRERSLGWTSVGDPLQIAADRQRYLRQLAGHSAVDLVTANQIHGDAVIDIEKHGEELTSSEGGALLQGDGLISCTPGRFVGVVTADCVPVLIADTRQRIVGSFHAGWRGTLAGIVIRGVEQMRAHHRAAPADMIAAIGPAIRDCCFAVGPEIRLAFAQRYTGMEDLFQERTEEEGHAPSLFMNLQEANRRQLVSAGLPADAITVVAECTACTRLSNGHRRYFSYRAEQGRTGRMLNVIGIVSED